MSQCARLWKAWLLQNISLIVAKYKMSEVFGWLQIKIFLKMIFSEFVQIIFKLKTEVFHFNIWICEGEMVQEKNNVLCNFNCMDYLDAG